MVSDYERGEIRLRGELIIQLAKILGTSADKLLGLEKQAKIMGTFGNRRLLRRVKEIEQIPRRAQEAPLLTIEAFLAKASRER